MEKILAKRTLSKKFYLPYLITLSILFVFSLLIKKGECVLLINGFNTPFLDFWFPLVTNLGDGLVFLPIVIVLLFIRFQYAIMGVLIALCSGIISSIFKHILFPNADRPKNYLDIDLLHFVPGVEVHGNNSFPSGHTITAFCAALFITLLCRDRVVSVLTLAMALLVGYSRIYLLQHFLIDVAAGAVIGCFTTYLVWEIFERTNKPDWMNGRINFNLKTNARSRQINRAS